MVINKAFTYALLTAVTLMPWNATAVNRFGIKNILPSNMGETYPILKSSPSNFNLNSSVNGVSSLASNVAENMLVKSLLEITQGKNQQALDTINALISSTPNFKLAHLVRGDLLMAQGKYLQSFGSADSNPTAAVKDLQDEARMRIEHYLASQSQQKMPNLLIAPNASQPYIIVVDTDKSRLYLYKNENGSLVYQKDFYVTVGKNGIEKQAEGDKRTPLGVYFTKPRLTQRLPDLYGDGAYPLNYPNEWDNTHQRKGSGIWLHGTPSDTYSRPPRASDGCVVLSNQDLRTLAPILQSGKVPVIITKNLEWLTESNASSAEKEAVKTALDSTINQWINDWRTQNTAQYLSHYSKDFLTDGINYTQWSEHKYRVQANKPKISVNVTDISMFSYPDAGKKLVVVDFTQDFKSPHLNNLMQKRQYWILENNQWKIIYEGAA